MGEPHIDGELAKVVERLAELLLVHVIPLFSIPKGKRPSLVGTGVLLRSDLGNFVVSARHVIEQARPPSALYYYSDVGELTRLIGSVRQTASPEGGSADDKFDLAVVRLPIDQKVALRGVRKVPLDVEACMPAAVPRSGKQYMATGFPRSRSKADPSSMQLKSAPHGFRTTSALPEDYERLGLRQETHIVMSLHVDQMHFLDGSIKAIPDPHGMSGSPVWLLVDEDGPNREDVTPLVGILVEYHKDAHQIVATDIGVALNLIRASAA